MSRVSSLPQVVLVAVALIGLVVDGATPVYAQTQDIQEGFGSSGGLTSSEVQKAYDLLESPVDLAGFDDSMTLLAALEKIIDQLEKKRLEFNLLVDSRALGQNVLHSTTILLTDLPRQTTLDKFLRKTLEQIPGDARLLYCKSSYFEITSQTEVDRRQISSSDTMSWIRRLLGMESPSAVLILEQDATAFWLLTGAVAVVCFVCAFVVWLIRRRLVQSNLPKSSECE